MSEGGRTHEVRQLLLSSLRRRRGHAAGLAAWSAIEAVPAVLSGRLVALAVDRGFLAHRAATGFLWLGVLAATVLVGAWGTRQVYRRLADLVEPFRDELVTRVVTSSLRRTTHPGAVADTAAVARLTQQVEIAREAYASVLMVVQGFAVTTFGAVLGLLSLVPLALALVLPPVVLGVGIFAAALARMGARQRASIIADERIAETAGAMAAGLRDVVAGGGEGIVAAGVGEHIDAQARATRDLARFTATRTVAVAAGGWLPLVLLLLGAGWLTSHGATTGALLGALTYVLQGVHPALQTLVRGLGGTGLWLLVALRRILDSTSGPDLPAPGAAPDRTPPEQQGSCHLWVSRLRFAYGPDAEPVIDDLDLFVPDGDHIAVVGPSGVGKSTLASLIAGVLEPQGGEVRIGGAPVHGRDPRVLALQRVLIPQEAYVFAGTLGENLAYLRPDVDPARLRHAVDELGVAELVDRLGGWAAELRPGGLSAGERQLITLVRAHLSPARLVVLDEATCHLDPAAEERVERAFARRPGTLVVIAHRISSARRARRILILDGGGARLGTHEELLAGSALYRDLVGHWHLGATA